VSKCFSKTFSVQLGADEELLGFSNLDAFVSAEFIVEAGANKLKRPVGGGPGNVKAGALKLNETQGT